MANQWNAGNPALTNQIANDIPDINENTHWLKDILVMTAGWKTSTIATVGPGIVTRRPKFTWTDGNTITIGPGGYFHEGSGSRQWVFWDATITFEAFRPGTGGSNAANAAASASAWHYIYLDDSAIVTQASPELDADCFMNSTTAPTWSDVAHGWYTGADRCIFAVLTDGSNNIIEFLHDGGDLVLWADLQTEASTIAPSNTWTDVNCATSVPGFSTKFLAKSLYYYVDTDTQAVVRTNGQTAGTGHSIGYVKSASAYSVVSTPIMSDTSQIIEVKTISASTNQITIHVDGWYFPVGM